MLVLSDADRSLYLNVFDVNNPNVSHVFGNTRLVPELERQLMLYPTSRDGVYRTGDRSEYVLVAGNHLANLPNYRAVAGMVDGPRLIEREFWSLPPQGKVDQARAERIRRHSRLSYGRARQAVEAALVSRGCIRRSERGPVEEKRR